jgi:hypothetical protein
MDSIWRPLVEKFCILLWQVRVGREKERYKREREEEMRKEHGWMRRALSLKLLHALLVVGGALSSLMPRMGEDQLI